MLCNGCNYTVRIIIIIIVTGVITTIIIVIIIINTSSERVRKQPRYIMYVMWRL